MMQQRQNYVDNANATNGFNWSVMVVLAATLGSFTSADLASALALMKLLASVVLSDSPTLTGTIWQRQLTL
jgi:hypothetical protein